MSLSRVGTREVIRLAPAATVFDAVQRMLERDVGSVVVVDERDHPCGILTDRDLVVRVLAPGLDAASVPLARVMTPHPVVVREEASADDAAWRMREHRVRRLPIVDARGVVVGIVTLDDLLGKVAAVRADVAELLAAFHATNQAV